MKTFRAKKAAAYWKALKVSAWFCMDAADPFVLLTFCHHPSTSFERLRISDKQLVDCTIQSNQFPLAQFRGPHPLWTGCAWEDLIAEVVVTGTIPVGGKRQSFVSKKQIQCVSPPDTINDIIRPGHWCVRTPSFAQNKYPSTEGWLGNERSEEERWDKGMNVREESRGYTDT